jgi:hypothetical protein
MYICGGDAQAPPEPPPSTRLGTPSIIGYNQLWILKAHLDDLEPVAEMKIAS